MDKWVKKLMSSPALAFLVHTLKQLTQNPAILNVRLKTRTVLDGHEFF